MRKGWVRSGGEGGRRAGCAEIGQGVVVPQAAMRHGPVVEAVGHGSGLSGWVGAKTLT